MAQLSSVLEKLNYLANYSAILSKKNWIEVESDVVIALNNN